MLQGQILHDVGEVAARGCLGVEWPTLQFYEVSLLASSVLYSVCVRMLTFPVRQRTGGDVEHRHQVEMLQVQLKAAEAAVAASKYTGVFQLSLNLCFLTAPY